MKILNIIFVAFLFFSSVHAQSSETPKKEFLVTLSQTNVQLAPGGTSTIDLHISRSKSYQKGDARVEVSSTLPEGLTISAEPEIGQEQKVGITLKASESLKGGTYYVLINAVINHKTKGTLLKVVVP